MNVLKGAAVLAVGQLATQILTLIRNIIIARMLSPENMGIAALFAITISLLEMISNLAVDMLLIQAKNGNDPCLQGVAHTFEVLRGMLIGIVIFVCAPVIAWLFDTPQSLWAFQVMALVPILRGFMHLDSKRLQRNMQYIPVVIVEVAPQAISVLIAWPMANWLRDYSAVLWLMIIQTVVALFVSHIVAERIFCLKWNREHASRLLSFGWPLLINGLLMFGIFQGDRIVVGTAYSMAELGVYSVALTFVLAIVMSLAKINGSLLLPLLAQVQDDKLVFRQRFVLSVQAIAVVGGMISLPFIIIGGELIVFIFGKPYASVVEFAAWLGGLLIARLIRLAPITAAIALGDTLNSMIANIARLLGVLAAVIAGWQALPLVVIVICGVVGELFAFIVSVLRLRYKHGFIISDSIVAPIIVLIMLFIIAVANNYGWFGVSSISRFYVCMSLLFVFPLVAMTMLSDLRRLILNLVLSRFPSITTLIPKR